MDTTVKFNIGGKLYEVSRTLLESFPETMLYSISSERWTKNDCTDPIFIERNGERFQYILDYMRDNEVNLPCSVSKDAVLNDFKFYGFQLEENESIKTTLLNPTDVADQMRFWKKRRLNKIDKLNQEAIILKSQVDNIELEQKYTEFCYLLLNHHLQTGAFDMELGSVDIEQYGGFYTHTYSNNKKDDDDDWLVSTNIPHHKYLSNTLLQKCAQECKISYISARIRRLDSFKNNDSKSLTASRQLPSWKNSRASNRLDSWKVQDLPRWIEKDSKTLTACDCLDLTAYDVKFGILKGELEEEK